MCTCACVQGFTWESNFGILCLYPLLEKCVHVHTPACMYACVCVSVHMYLCGYLHGHMYSC